MATTGSTPDFPAMPLVRRATARLGCGLWLAVVLSGSGEALASARLTRPGEGEGPTQVAAQIFVLDVDEVDAASQSFTANVFFRLRWHDPRLAGLAEHEIVRKLDEIWHPQAIVLNQQRQLATLSDVVRIAPDGSVTFSQRLWGRYSQPLDLRDFPLDSQSFRITLIAAEAREGEVVFVPMPDRLSGLADTLSLPDWSIDSSWIEPIAYEPVAGGPRVPGIQLEFRAARRTGYYAIKVMLPLLLILGMSWTVFWIDPRESGTQISVAATSMLTLIAYRFSIGNLVPPISYLTRMDGFILVGTLLVFASLVEVVITTRLASSGRLPLARRLDVACRGVFPIATALLIVRAFLL